MCGFNFWKIMAAVLAGAVLGPVEAPNGSRLWVRRCRVQKGVLWTSEAESLPESEHRRGRRRGALPPNGVFILCSSTLSCLHLSSGSQASRTPSDPAGCSSPTHSCIFLPSLCWFFFLLGISNRDDLSQNTLLTKITHPRSE